MDEHPPHLVEPLSFPVRPLEKRSYCQNTVVWIRRAGLQSDIQKILRQARKLPEKTQQFYKELNRLRRAAVNFGFVELLDGMATILERECNSLPPSAHQECTLQLRHAAEILRRPLARDPKFVIVPLKTRYQQDNDWQNANLYHENLSNIYDFQVWRNVLYCTGYLSAIIFTQLI